jgi:mono/diheme cytochrome c family protein
MISTSHDIAARRTLALGLGAGAWLCLSAFTSAVEAPLPGSPASVAPQPDSVLVAQADATPAPTPVHYSTEQADRGKAFFIKHCAECHGEDLRGGLNGGPPLRGLSFEGKYAEGAPASAIFEFMSTLMPPDSPGRYSAAQYADAMAYILKVNGFKAGAELPSDVDALNTLTMEK